MKLFVVVYVVNTALGAVLYLDVLRTRRHQAWLLAFWVFMYPAMVAYLATRRRAVVDGRRTGRLA